MARKETKEERHARELAEAFSNDYELLTEDQIKTKIVELLDQIDDLAEQRQAQMDTMKDMILGKQDELEYARDRRHFLRSAQGQQEIEAAVNTLLGAA